MKTQNPQFSSYTNPKSARNPKPHKITTNNKNPKTPKPQLRTQTIKTNPKATKQTNYQTNIKSHLSAKIAINIINNPN